MSMGNISDMTMPKYSPKEEKLNFWTHFVGVVIGILTLIGLEILAVVRKLNLQIIVGILIYGMSLIALYGASSLYHLLSSKSYYKKIMRIIDHCTVFILIAGTYTPIALLALPENLRLIILLVEWIGAIIGIAINAYDLSNKWITGISMVLYLVMGWAIIVVPKIIGYLTLWPFVFILTGGIIYTLGAIFYGIGHNKKWFHSIFHIFCIVATILQEIGIIILLLNY